MADPADKGIAVDIEGVGKVYFPRDYTPEKIKFSIENDILPRIGQEPPSKPLVVKAGEELRSIPRQIGLTARQGAEGLGQVADIVAAPIGATVNTVANLIGVPEQAGGVRLRVPAAPVAGLAKRGADALGLPTESNPTERVVGDITRLMAGAGGMAGAAAKVAPMAQGAARTVADLFSQNVGSQVASAAGAGGSGGAVREAGGGPLEQFGAAVAGGLSAYGLTQLGIKAYQGVNSLIQSLRQTSAPQTQVNVMLNQILQENGIPMSEIPGNVRAQLATEVRKAVDTGRELDPAVIKRIADYGMVGATPTRGTVTLDPAQITQERNLAKLGMQGNDPELQQLGRIQNQNNRALIQRMNDMGAGTANADPLVAAQRPIATLRAQDKAAENAVTKLYDAYREQGTEHTRIPQERLTTALGKVIDEFTLDALPAPVISRLKEFGFLDSKVTRNFTIKESNQFNKILNDNNPGFGSAAGAIRVLKSAVNKSMIEDVPDVGKTASQALKTAREAAAARFAAQESGAGVTAALEGVAPDQFIKNFVLGSGPKGATAEVEKMLFQLKNDPASLQAIKENVVSHLKNQALSGAADEVGNFSPSAFNRALTNMGDMKLKLFFSPDEIAQLKAIGRVASYETFQPRGSAVNNSNTAGAFAGILDRIASSPLVGKIPFGNAAIRDPARNWSAQIGIDRAVDPYAAASNALPKPQTGSIKDLLGPALLLAAPRSESRNNDQRR